MRLIAVGVNQSSAPLALRERLSSAAAGVHLHAALGALRSHVPEGFILSTCSRTEIYAYAPAAADPVALLSEVLGSADAFDRSELRHACYVHTGEDAARHALRVTSGLESIVLGEDQIHAQMKKALACAREACALGPVTERVGAAALSCSKRVRTHTGLSRHGVSLESLAVRTAEDTFAAHKLTRKHVLVIGAGESAAIILKRLKGSGATDVTVVSRTQARAQELALAHGVRARGADHAAELADALIDADVVFCCTSAPHPVVTPELLAPRKNARGDAPLVCVDLGMPRDVHADVARDGAQVISLESLSAKADAHRASRREHVPAAEAIVARETARFTEWLVNRAARHVIAGSTPLLEQLRHDTDGLNVLENTAS